MLISDTLHPSNTIYYRGAHVLQILQKEGNMTIAQLYGRMQETEGMSYPVLVLCLDWLFLINAAILLKTGEIKLCSSKD